MNKNAIYLAVFAALCVLAGVLVGASITRSPNLLRPGPQRSAFRERAERFMGYGPRHYGNRRGGEGPVKMLTVKLGLDEEQKTKVTQILEKTRQEIEEVGKNVRSAITEIKEKSDKQIMDILTPQQQEKFKALQKAFERRCAPKWSRGQRGSMKAEEKNG